MFQTYYENNQKEDPVLTIHLNGNSKHPNLFMSLKLEQVSRMSFNQLFQLLSVKFGFLVKSTGVVLRLFDDQGVEIYQEDLKFIQKDKVLYASDGPDFDPASCFSEYRLMGKLGEGGFGNVLLGQHKLTKQMVAIKIMHTNILGNAQDIDMVFREAEMLKSLRHKNIVNIYQCYTLSNMQVVFVMEYLEGGELLLYLNERGKLTEQEARIFIKQITEAVHYCHQQKLIHRDLKMENIILQQKGQTSVYYAIHTPPKIKLIDFGIAGLANNFNVDKIDVGSLRYMAPETFRNAKIGPSIDVWALGVILYGLTTGNLPFKGSSCQEIKLQIMTANYQLPTNIEFSVEYRDLISRIFIIDPLKRIKVNDILSHAWMVKENSVHSTMLSEIKSTKQLHIAREVTVKFVDEIQPVQHNNKPKKLKLIVRRPQSPIREEDKFLQPQRLSSPRNEYPKLQGPPLSITVKVPNRPFSYQPRFVKKNNYHPYSINEIPSMALRKQTLTMDQILQLNRQYKPRTLDNIKIDTDNEESQRTHSESFLKKIVQKANNKPFIPPLVNRRSNSQQIQYLSVFKKEGKHYRIKSVRNE